MLECSGSRSIARDDRGALLARSFTGRGATRLETTNDFGEEIGLRR
jgi:hypothetical protein